MDKDAGCIREISRRVQLSKSTVSKALHNCGNVDAGTKEAILRAAREVQYAPAGARRAKIQAGETVVGVVLPINPYAFWNEAIRGVKDAMAAQKGAHLTLSLYAGVHSEADALYCLDYMEDMRADVLVVTPAPFPAMTERLRGIAARIPVVFFNETADGVPFLFYAGANFYQDGIRLARACRDALALRPDILWIHGAHTPMSRRPGRRLSAWKSRRWLPALQLDRRGGRVGHDPLPAVRPAGPRPARTGTGISQRLCLTGHPAAGMPGPAQAPPGRRDGVRL